MSTQLLKNTCKQINELSKPINIWMKDFAKIKIMKINQTKMFKKKTPQYVESTVERLNNRLGGIEDNIAKLQDKFFETSQLYTKKKEENFLTENGI